MKFFQPKKAGIASRLVLRGQRAALDLLADHFSEAASDLNGNLQEPSLKIKVGKPVKTRELGESGLRDVLRLYIKNANQAVSIRAVNDTCVEAFIVPASQLELVPKTEYTSRLKFKLTKHDSDEWWLDDQPLTHNELRMLVLTTTNDLLKYSTNSSAPLAEGARIRIGELSLTTGLRDLLFEKGQLVTDLLTQQERLQSCLAGDLHDSIIADLLFLARELKERPDIPSENVCRAIHDVVRNLRDICSDLSSREIRDWGLPHAIGELAARLCQRNGIELKIQIDELHFDLPYEASLQIYRIAQEILNNAAKHSQCRNIVLSMSCSATDLHLKIRDDGIGFTTKAKKNPREGGMGMHMLKERTDMLKSMGFSCSLSLDSKPGEGTAIELQVDVSRLSTGINSSI